MNFQKAQRASSHLRDAARFLNRFSANENDYIQHQLRKNWTGENADSFLLQNRILYQRIREFSMDLEVAALRIEEKAHRVRTAEERALAIAQKSGKK